MKEITVQDGAIEWLEELGYQHVEGNLLERELKKVVLEKELQRHLKTAYPKVPETALNQAFALFTQAAGMDVAYRNQDFHRKLTQGVTVSWKDARGKENAQHIYAINFQEPSQNSFICADEVSIIGKNKRRADLIVFINGLPLVVFEFKNMFDANVGIDNAHNQIGHYVLDIPQLFDFNAIIH